MYLLSSFITNNPMRLSLLASINFCILILIKHNIPPLSYYGCFYLGSSNYC